MKDQKFQSDSLWRKSTPHPSSWKRLKIPINTRKKRGLNTKNGCLPISVPFVVVRNLRPRSGCVGPLFSSFLSVILVICVLCGYLPVPTVANVSKWDSAKSIFRKRLQVWLRQINLSKASPSGLRQINLSKTQQRADEKIMRVGRPSVAPHNTKTFQKCEQWRDASSSQTRKRWILKPFSRNLFHRTRIQQIDTISKWWKSQANLSLAQRGTLWTKQRETLCQETKRLGKISFTTKRPFYASLSNNGFQDRESTPRRKNGQARVWAMATCNTIQELEDIIPERSLCRHLLSTTNHRLVTRSTRRLRRKIWMMQDQYSAAVWHPALMKIMSSEFNWRIKWPKKNKRRKGSRCWQANTSPSWSTPSSISTNDVRVRAIGMNDLLNIELRHDSLTMFDQAWKET